MTRLALVAIVPPLALLLGGWATCWIVEPAMLRDRFGRWVPPLMATMLGLGELTVLLARGAQHGGEVPTDARRMVQRLLGHKLVGRAIRAEGLAVRRLPSAQAPAGRSGLDQRPAGARAAVGADQAAAVGAAQASRLG